MSFLSVEFALCFVLFFALYWSVRPFPRLQNGLLLIASYGILASFSWYAAVAIAGYTLFTYVMSLLIWRQASKRWLIFAMLAAVINLAVFKYFDFFRSSVQSVLTGLGLDILLPGMEILIPLGISFYTFHSVSYLVDLYKNKLQPVSLPTYALYLAFFPSVVAGPINRAQHLLPQILPDAPRSLDQPAKAYALILLGIAKVYWLSAFLADTWANPVFANPLEYNSLDVLLGLYAYALQLFLNFSGYTDLVTGVALLLGFKLPVNFNAPYLANNLRDFWQRWHISLSTWIRDYIYIPLGGNRDGFTRTQVNLMLAMLISGLWHGASYNFILWGAIHGLGVVLLNIADKYFGRNALTNKWPLLAGFITVQYVCFAWIFFRSPTWEGSLEFLTALGSNLQIPLQFNAPWYLAGFFILWRLYPFLAKLPNGLTCLLQRTPWVVQPILVVLIAWGLITLAPAGIPGFIYANF